MIRVLVNGAKGKMGREVVCAVEGDPELELVGQGDLDSKLGELITQTSPDVVVDFTHPDSVLGNARLSLSKGCFAVIGTTGLSQADLKTLHNVAQANDVGIAVCPNFAIGAVMMMTFAREAAKHMARAEIIEYHHDRKADAPSGTAIKTAEMIKDGNPDINSAELVESELYPGARGSRVESIPIHSVRLPGFVASQAVIFGSEGQTFTLRHDTLSRTCFMPGVLIAVKAIVSHKGLVYGLEHFLK